MVCAKHGECLYPRDRIVNVGRIIGDDVVFFVADIKAITDGEYS